ncbi:MAG: alanine/glycine:cation symporter family protein [Gammaproteobacteria bacterium]
MSSSAWASEGALDKAISDAIAPFVDVVVSIVFYSVTIGGVSVPLIVVWLVVAAAFFTLYFRFINIHGFKHAIGLVTGKYDKAGQQGSGEVTHFQALATALSGTVGLGNIAGVAVAISYGGPGATFWMILAGLLGMSSKFVECTLGVKYRTVHPDGSVSGGPMFYLSKGLDERGMRHFGLALAGFFALCCVLGALGGGNLFQANQAYDVIIGISGHENSVFAHRGWLFGVLLAGVVGMVIIGGIKRIARVTEKLVPAMAILYVVTAVYILLANVGQIPDAFELILVGAFSPEGVTGGAIGVMIQGFKRAAFSNEAGIGSASIAHSAVKTKEPVTEGFVSLLEPFIDTVVICTMTALVLIITGFYEQGAALAASGELSGAQLTSDAFASTVSWFPYVLALAVMMFAFSTMISWSYYGLKAWTYLFGRGAATELTFKLLFCAFVIIGCTMDLSQVVNFSDSAIFAMSIANLIGLYILAPSVRRDLEVYLASRPK